MLWKLYHSLIHDSNQPFLLLLFYLFFINLFMFANKLMKFLALSSISNVVFIEISSNFKSLKIYLVFIFWLPLYSPFNLFFYWQHSITVNQIKMVGILLTFLSIIASVSAMIHPIEIRGNHFYDSITNKPVSNLTPTSTEVPFQITNIPF